MAEKVDRLVVTLQVDDEWHENIRALAEEVAAEYAQAFEARIRKVVYDTMRERDVRLSLQNGKASG